MKHLLSVLSMSVLLASSVRANVQAQLPELASIQAQFAPVELNVDYSKLSPEDLRALKKILSAASLMDDIYLEQRWKGNSSLKAKLAKLKTPLGKAEFQVFENAKGPWSPLGERKAFVENVPEKQPPGCGFLSRRYDKGRV